MFCIINYIFWSLLWLSKNPRVKLEQSQRPKDVGGLALPNPWVYYLASQMQHIVCSMCSTAGVGEREGDPSTRLLVHTFGTEEIERGLKWLVFCKSNK